jgi:hypothetical protein
MKFDYTKTYSFVYSKIKNENIPHEYAHRSSLKICDALWDIWLFSQEHAPEIEKTIKEIFSVVSKDGELAKQD